MKQKILLLSVALMIATIGIINAQSHLVNDTTIHFNQKTIQITDSAEQIKVMVYKTGNIPYKQLYKGIFTDEKSFEQYSVETHLSFDFPFRKRKKHDILEGHFVGVGIGKLYITDGLADFNDIDGLKIANSNEIFWNPIGYTFPLVKGYFGITTGAGIIWRSLHVGNNQHLANTDGITVIESAPGDINYYYSRLRMFDINLPLYAEIQPFGKSTFFISGGMLLGINTFSSYKVKYRDEQNRRVKTVKGKDYNVNPFSLSYIVQAGWNDVGFYAKYTPTGLFQKDKGPDVQTMSVGIILDL